jgi:isocitrate lyase
MRLWLIFCCIKLLCVCNIYTKNWKKNLDDATIAKFQHELGAMGYKFQFITLAGFHSLNAGMFDLASGYRDRNMSAFVDLQEREFALQQSGFTAVKHQREVGTGYFDAVTTTIEQNSSTTAMKNSTETEQFH